jgi:phosphatidylglycerophosphatase A
MSIQTQAGRWIGGNHPPFGKLWRLWASACIKKSATSEIRSRAKTCVEPSPQPVVRRWTLSWLIATFFGVGYLRPGPGTYASAITVGLWWAASRAVPSGWQMAVAALIAAAATIIGIPPSTVVARESGLKDPGFVVIDEVAGQMIALIGLPVDWKYLLAGFILFRSFDIVKPFPLRRLEKLPAGTGIMMDDVGAGLYALVLLHAWRYFMSG